MKMNIFENLNAVELLYMMTFGGVSILIIVFGLMVILGKLNWWKLAPVARVVSGCIYVAAGASIALLVVGATHDMRDRRNEYAERNDAVMQELDQTSDAWEVVFVSNSGLSAGVRIGGCEVTVIQEGQDDEQMLFGILGVNDPPTNAASLFSRVRAICETAGGS